MTARRAGVAGGVAVAVAAGLLLALCGRGADETVPEPAAAERAPTTPTPPAPAAIAPALAGRPAGAAPAPASAIPAAEAGTGTVVVTVVREDATPFPNASVTVEPNAGKPLGPVETGADGVATFLSVPEGDVSAYAKAPAFETSYAPGHVRGGETARVRITMRALVPVTGHVRTPDGTGVAATVTVLRGGTFAGTTETCGGAVCRVAATTSASDGAFRVDVPRDVILTLKATAPDWAAGEAVVRRAAAGEEVALVLCPGGTVRGVVRAPDGRPCGGARAWLVPADEPAFLENPRYVIGADGSRSWSSSDDDESGGFMSSSRGGSGAVGVTRAAVRGTSSADGSFSFEGLPLPGAYRVLAEGCGGARGVSADAALSAAARSATADVPLTPRAVLWVRLETPDGQPDLHGRGVTLIGARDHFLDPRGGRLRAEGFEEGRAKFEGLLAGAYEVLAEMDESVPVSRTVDVPAGETVEVAIRGVRGRTLAGTVRDRTGKPVAGAKVRIDVPAGAGVLEQSAEATADAGGAFRLAGLQDAAGKVTAKADGFVQSAPVEARAGPEPLALVLRRGAEIRGRLAVPAGASLPGDAWIALGVKGRMRNTADAKIAADGSFRLGVDRLDEPTTFVLLPRVGAWVLLGTFALASEEVRDVGTIAVEEGRTIRGRVVDGQGAPVTGVVVEADPREMAELCDRDMHGSQEATSDATGRFAMKGVMRSAIVLRTQHPPFAPAAVRQEGDGDAEVVLRRGAFLVGRLLDATGAPVAGRSVRWLGSAPEALPVFGSADEKGAFEIGPVASGAFSVAVYLGGEEALPLTSGTLAEGERRTVELRLPEGASPGR